MWVAMDPPTQDQAPQLGTLYIRNFSVRGEAGARARGGRRARRQTRGGVDFSEMSCRVHPRAGPHGECARAWCAGRWSAPPSMARSITAKDEVHLRGTFVPFYGLNNMFGQIPIVAA